MSWWKLYANFSRRNLLLVIAATIVLTLIAVLLAVNLSSGEKKIQQSVERLYATDDPQFIHVMGVLLGPPVLGGNRYEVLLNGDQIFPSMLAAIRGARQTINFETYIYWSEAIGKEFADALTERARAGIKVNVLLDWIGSAKMEKNLVDEMKAAGVTVLKFHPPHWSHLSRLNNRTHRKLLIVDGKIGFTGGVGIAGQWTGNAQDPEHWRDTHFKVEGPVVAQIQSVFMDNWIKATGKVLHSVEYFPTLANVGDGRAQMFSSSPTGGSESMHLMYLMAITAARRSIHLSSSYFVPDALAVKALADAARRGVRVQIITPGSKIDSDVVRRASRSRWGPLLEAGVQIAEFQPTMFHCKVLVVDGLWVSVGSTNFDNRSFRLNDEANLNLLDEQFAAEQVKVFEHDLSRSKVVTLQAWRDRPWKERAMEWIGQMLKSQL